MKNIATTGAENPIPGRIPREKDPSKRHTHPKACCSPLYNGHDMETTKVSIDRSTEKEMCYTYSMHITQPENRIKSRRLWQK